MGRRSRQVFPLMTHLPPPVMPHFLKMMGQSCHYPVTKAFKNTRIFHIHMLTLFSPMHVTLTPYLFCNSIFKPKILITELSWHSYSTFFLVRINVLVSLDAKICHLYFYHYRFYAYTWKCVHVFICLCIYFKKHSMWSHSIFHEHPVIP